MGGREYDHFQPPNAAPEWQAGSMRGRSRELVVTCPLEGLVRQRYASAAGAGVSHWSRRSKLEQWRQGFDVVYAVRRRRAGESRTKRLTAFGFYRLMGRLSSTAIPADTGDFRLMDRCVVDALALLPERSRFMKGLFAWVGFRQTSIDYDRDARHGGRSNWNYWKLWNLALDGITSFSRVPLQVLSGGGLVIACLALLYGAWMVLRTLLFGIDLPGYASLITAVLFLGGLQLIGLGVLGEYLGRVFEEVKRRPLYLVRERWEQGG